MPKKREKKKKSILIADDEPNILDLLKMLFDEQYDLMISEDGKDVLEKVAKRRPDLILLDVMMPKMNGYEVCEILKKDPKTSDITIAMLSAKGQERDIIQGLRLGADHYITKPFNPTELQDKVEEIINK